MDGSWGLWAPSRACVAGCACAAHMRAVSPRACVAPRVCRVQDRAVSLHRVSRGRRVCRGTGVSPGVRESHIHVRAACVAVRVSRAVCPTSRWLRAIRGVRCDVSGPDDMHPALACELMAGRLAGAARRRATFAEIGEVSRGGGGRVWSLPTDCPGPEWPGRSVPHSLPILSEHQADSDRGHVPDTSQAQGSVRKC